MEAFPVSNQAGPCRHWTVEEIPYGSIDRQYARVDPYLLYLVAGASFVEITPASRALMPIVRYRRMLPPL